MQHTLSRSVELSGVGLHSGAETVLRLLPADVGAGLTFRRVDVADRDNLIPARWDSVVDTRLCTVVANKAGVSVGTIEHLMAALSACGVDNAVIELDGPEVPIMDGSAAPFVFLIQSAGIREQSAAKRFIRILKPVRIEENGKYVQFLPHNGYKISFTIEFDHPVFNDKPQTVNFDFSSTSYVKEVCRARTFGFLSDYEKLRECDLAKGGSLDNAVVVDNYRVLNEDGLRFEDEFVKHKVLDAIGDLYLLGSSLIGAFEGYKSGHELNNKLLRALIAQQDAWEYTYFDIESYQHLIHSELSLVEA